MHSRRPRLRNSRDMLRCGNCLAHVKPRGLLQNCSLSRGAAIRPLFSKWRPKFLKINISAVYINADYVFVIFSHSVAIYLIFWHIIRKNWHYKHFLADVTVPKWRLLEYYRKIKIYIILTLVVFGNNFQCLEICANVFKTSVFTNFTVSATVSKWRPFEVCRKHRNLLLSLVRRKFKVFWNLCDYILNFFVATHF